MGSRRHRTAVEYALSALRNPGLILVTVLVFVVSVRVAQTRVPRVYESRAVVAADRPNASEPQIAEPRRREEAVEGRVTSNELLYREATENPIFERLRADLSIERRVELLRAALKVSAGDSDGTFTISLKDQEPDFAHGVLSDLVSRLTSRQESIQIRTDARLDGPALARKVQELTSKRRSMELRYPWLVGVEDRSAVTASPPPLRHTEARVAERQAPQPSLESLKDEQFVIQEQLASLDKRISVQRQIVEQQSRSPQLVDNATYAALVSRRTELQGQRDTLINRQELTDKHPRVVAIDDQITAINRQIDELRKQESGNLRQSPEARELASLESERNRLALELEVKKREIGRTVRADSTASAAQPAAAAGRQDRMRSGLVENYLDLKRAYAEAAGQLEGALKNAAPQGSVDRYRLVEAATIPAAPSALKPLALMLFAGLVGVVIGALISLAVEWRTFGLVHGTRDAEHYGRLPLLGIIPATPTAEDRRRARLMLAGRVMASATIGVAATLAITRLLLYTRLLEHLVNK